MLPITPSDMRSIGYLKFGEFDAYPAELNPVKHIDEASLTIPGQARDLGALLASARFQGGLLPRHGVPTYDDSEEAAIARLQFEELDDEQRLQLARSAAAAAEKKDEPNEDAADKAPEHEGDDASD